MILFPGDAEFTKVKQCAEGNMFLLRFKTSDLKMFFWMQENDENYDSICNQVNLAINAFGEIDPMQVEEMAESIPSQNVPSNASSITLSRLQDILANVKVPVSSTLSSILTSDKLKPLFENPEFLNRFYPHFPPEAPKTKQELESIVRSPQFQQVRNQIMKAVASLDEALRNGELSIVLSQFDLPSEAGSGVDALLSALRKKREGK